MKVVHLAAEFSPIARVGGLGEVVVGLSRELTRLGHQVDVIIPKYDFIDTRKISHLKMEIPDFKCLEKGSLHANAMWSGTSEECALHLLESRHPAGYFHRGTIYHCEDDVARFLYFSKACLEYLKLRNEPIDVLHLHDWHVAIAAVLMKDLFRLPIKAILLTIHNGEYQGQCASWDLDAIGLKGQSYLTPAKMQDDDPDKPLTINLLKGGIVYSDWVNAVSPTYMKEILTPKTGAHIDTTLRKVQTKTSGILNGIDLVRWNPANDPHLPTPYSSSSSLNAILEAKESARAAIRKQFKLSKDHRPWVGSITRLVPQKGPELLEEGLRQTLDLGGSFLLLGSSPLPEMQRHFDQLKKEYTKNKAVLLHFTFDESLSHQLYAALDFLLVPSLYEPCGLTQLIAMRYGTLPIARAVGGLKDTVFDCDNPTIPIEQKNGFLFQAPTAQATKAALQRAIHQFRTDSATFQQLIQQAMNQDFGWEKPAQEYIKLYSKLSSKKTPIFLSQNQLGRSEKPQGIP